MKTSLINRAIDILKNAGYRVSDCSTSRSCFDILAKKEKILLIKVLANIDGLTRRCSLELRNVASIISAIPLILSDHMKSAKLCRGIIYTRYNIQVINIATLEDIVNEKMPLIYSVRGNYCIKIDPSLLVKLRKELDMTQEELADELGISKQSVRRYEFYGRMSVEVAEHLMEILKNNIAIPNDVFISGPPLHHGYDIMGRRLTKLRRMVLEKFRDMGFSAILTNAPFDIVAMESEDERILTTVSDDSRRLKRKIDTIDEISNIIGSYRVCISNRHEDSDVIIIKPRDLNKIKDSEELIQMLANS
ncbi:MAG: hypothetical protein DRO89_05515 [Candidatus Altiarchaeales archaeon]|nr:MAG: hypothetical protein DRO89_05515 [Candidatus Altiarchaeales archaeon]